MTEELARYGADGVEDLAAIYGVPTKRLNDQVRRNPDRFPPDFAFVLTVQEVAGMRSQIATASTRNIRYRPYAFTEHGAIMAASILRQVMSLLSPPDEPPPQPPPDKKIGFGVREPRTRYGAGRRRRSPRAGGSMR